jgi:cell shape-determining protein MreC
VKIRALVLLGTVVAVCLLLLTLQMRGQTAGASDVLAVLTTPVQSALARVNRATVGVWSTYRDRRTCRAENRRLRDEAQQMRVEALQVTETIEENRRLRRLLALKARCRWRPVRRDHRREWGGWCARITVTASLRSRDAAQPQ